jgi:hypothetical protein
VVSFLKLIDFLGKSVIVVGVCFNNMMGFVEDFETHLVNANLIKKDGFYGVVDESDSSLDEKVVAFLTQI